MTKEFGVLMGLVGFICSAHIPAMPRTPCPPLDEFEKKQKENKPLQPNFKVAYVLGP